MNQRAKKYTLTAVKAIIIVAVIVILIVYGKDLKNLNIRAVVSSTSNITLAILIVLGIYAIKSVLFVIPASILYISVGIAFPTNQAILINAAGIAIEVTLSYFFGRFLGGNTVKRMLRKYKGGRKLLELKIPDKPVFVFIVRFVPAFPIDFSSLFFGTTSKNYWSYAIFSLIGLLPRVITFTLMGNSIFRPFSKEFLIPLFSLGALAGLGMFIYWKISVKNKKKPENETD